MAIESSGLRTIRLPAGDAIPVLGQGTYRMGEDRARRREELAALRAGVDLGMTLIDTAELYGSGAAEALVGEAIAGRRDEVFLVSKVLPSHATQRGTVGACEASVRRLGTDRIDLYLLHWRGGVALEETVAGFEALVKRGLIRYWGVSNFDVSDMEELLRVVGGNAVQANQVLYNPTRRGIEVDLFPWSQGRGLAVMAYSPVEEGRLLRDRTLERIGARHGATAAQVALAWVLRQPGVCTIPKAGTVEHVRENRAAAELVLSEEDLAELDREFPAPRRKVRLEMI